MTLVYAPGVKVTDVFGGTWNIGDVSHPDAVKVRTTDTWKRMPTAVDDIFTKWAQDTMKLTHDRLRENLANHKFSVSTPKAAGPDAKPAEPKPGNTEREMVFRVVAAVEKFLAELPPTHAQVAGFLQAKGYIGDTSADHNALANYLADKVGQHIEFTEPMLARNLHKVKIWVESNGTIIESPAYQVALNPMPWQTWFVERLRAGDFNALVVR